MNDLEREKIREQAKDILEKFGKSLQKVKFKERKKEEELSGFREEGKENGSSNDFRERVFRNAPNKDSDFIIAEKKKW